MSAPAVLVAFGIVVSVLLFIDLFVVHRRAKVVTLRSALAWSIIWILAAAVFGVVVMNLYGGGEAVGAYFSVFIVEKALSVDNVFLWLVVFTSLGVPKQAQRRVLLYGVLGALVLRSAAVSAGVAIMETFTWVLWIAGAFLVFAGYKMWRERHESHGEDHGESKIARLVRRVLPTTDGFRGEKFVVREGGKLLATPLLLALILVEMTDIVLALDALPATLGISTDGTIVLAATGFALLGLRALFFLLSGVAERLRYLKVAVAVILVYIGVTLIVENIVEAYHASTAQSIGVILVVLAAAVVASLRAEQIVSAGAGAQEDGPDAREADRSDTSR